MFDYCSRGPERWCNLVRKHCSAAEYQLAVGVKGCEINLEVNPIRGSGDLFHERRRSHYRRG